MADNDDTPAADQPPEQRPRYNQEQYELLLRCSEKKDISEWNQWREQHPNEPIHLEGADLSEGHLEGADFMQAHLAGAVLPNAHLAGADLRGAHIEGTNLMGADLTKADLFGAHCEGANLLEASLQHTRFTLAFLQGTTCRKAIVDGGTLIWGCKVNKWKQEKGGLEGYTDFAGAGLGEARIEPRIRQLLEYNIRRSNWENWYRHGQFQGGKRQDLPRLQQFWRKLLVRSFWWLSDYGLSTQRVLCWFFGLAGLFAAVYSWFAWLRPPGIIENLYVEPFEPLWHYGLLAVFRPIYFSIVTMTTLGFGDMHAHPTSLLGHFLLTLQVLLGYLMLAALVTRLAILFTAGGPAGTFTELSEERKRELQQLQRKPGNS